MANTVLINLTSVKRTVSTAHASWIPTGATSQTAKYPSWRPVCRLGLIDSARGDRAHYKCFLLYYGMRTYLCQHPGSLVSTDTRRRVECAGKAVARVDEETRKRTRSSTVGRSERRLRCYSRISSLIGPCGLLTTTTWDLGTLSWPALILPGSLN